MVLSINNLPSYFTSFAKLIIFWLCIGFIGQAVFASRFWIQWIASEREGRSIIPIAFWFLSLAGGLTLLSYAIYRKDPVFIVGQSTGLLIYSRNLYLIYNEKKLINGEWEKTSKGWMWTEGYWKKIDINKWMTLYA